MSKSYIDLINRFWNADQTVGGINQYATKLYFYILRSCNEHFWKQPVSHSDRFLADRLSMSVNTLRKAKSDLTNIGLLSYKIPGKVAPKRTGQTLFYLPTVSPHDTVTPPTVSPRDTVKPKKDTPTVSPDDTVEEIQEDVLYHDVTQTVSPHDTVTPPTVSPRDTKSKTTIKTEDIIPIPNGIGSKEANSDTPKNEKPKTKKSSSAPRRKNVDKPATPHWEILVKTWFDLYEGWYGEKPSFEGADSRNLKAIVTNLQKRSESKGMEWTEVQSASAFTAFLTFARNDKWLKDNFLLQNLNRQFDKIITNAKNSSKSRSVARAFNAIDEMYN